MRTLERGKLAVGEVLRCSAAQQGTEAKWSASLPCTAAAPPAMIWLTAARADAAPQPVGNAMLLGAALYAREESAGCPTSAMPLHTAQRMCARLGRRPLPSGLQVLLYSCPPLPPAPITDAVRCPPPSKYHPLMRSGVTGSLYADASSQPVRCTPCAHTGTLNPAAHVQARARRRS